MITFTFIVETDENGKVNGTSYGNEKNWTINELAAMGLALRRKSELLLEEIPEECLSGGVIVTESAGNA